MAPRTNDQWLADLRAAGPEQEAALADLRAVLLNGLPYALAAWLPPGDPQFEPLAEEVVQETLLRVLAHLGTFEGRSQFTTWVHKIAVRVALTELRRKRWQDVSLDELVEGEAAGLAKPGLMSDPAPTPETSAEQVDLLQRLERILQEELTEKQRRAMLATLRGMPLEEAARRMNMERNALYKLLHDARLRLKQRLSEEGLAPEDFRAVFESR
ncbi:MAG TPA: sigma-70 family RNA polymerase sigma factor [Anaerolineales bacterium]|nr:sigma-70 family RNA polymerase sigma factor [Anaerolineales bacterium]